jgi:hypothetical protein
MYEKYLKIIFLTFTSVLILHVMKIKTEILLLLHQDIKISSENSQSLSCYSNFGNYTGFLNYRTHGFRGSRYSDSQLEEGSFCHP